MLFNCKTFRGLKHPIQGKHISFMDLTHINVDCVYFNVIVYPVGTIVTGCKIERN